MDTKALRQKILDLAIRGKLVPQDPNDEPASVLLERIRAEKQQMVKEGKLKAKDVKNDTVIFKGEDNLHYEKFQDGTVKCIEDEIPFEVPKGWEWARGIVCFKGMKSQKPFGDFFDYIDIESIDNKAHAISQPKHMLVKEAPSRASRKIENGSVLFSLVRPYLENIAYIDENYSGCIASTGFYVCNSSGVMLPKYMFLLMTSKYVINGLNQFMKGDNSPSIRKEDIEHWLYPIPPINEQKSIVEKVDSIVKIIYEIQDSSDDVVKYIKIIKSQILDLAIRGKLVLQDPNDEPASILLERIRTEKEELIKQGKIKRDKKESIIFKGEDNLHYEKFQDGTVKCIEDEIPFEVPEGWEWCNLSMIGTTNIGLTYSPDDIDNEGTIVLRSCNIVNDEINLNESVRVKTNIRNNQYVQPNDILICARNGSRALVGKCAIIPEYGEKMSFGAFMAVYCTKFYNYIVYYLRSNQFRSVFNDGNSTAINQLTQDMLKRALVPLPPLQQQQRITEVISQMFKRLQNIEENLK